MDMDTAILLRTIERLTAVLIGGLSIYLGYRLFLRVPEQHEGEGQFKLWDVSIIMSRIGPGAFFALFGAAVVGLSIVKGIVVADAQERGPKDSIAKTATPPDAHSKSYSGMGASTADTADQRADNRALLRRDIAILNNFLPKLRADLAEQDRTQVELAIPRIKFALMRPMWDESTPGWGEPARFEAWLKDAEPDPPPADIAAAVEYFRYAKPGASP
jgi:hypothetical protein